VSSVADGSPRTVSVGGSNPHAVRVIAGAMWQTVTQRPVRLATAISVLQPTSALRPALREEANPEILPLPQGIWGIWAGGVWGGVWDFSPLPRGIPPC